MKNAEKYADIIIRDEREKIVSEKTILYTNEKIERIYEFEGGAVIKYEWQNVSSENASETPRFNHRFTLIKLPQPNPQKFKTGVVKVINYPPVR